MHCSGRQKDENKELDVKKRLPFYHCMLPPRCTMLENPQAKLKNSPRAPLSTSPPSHAPRF